VTELELPVQLHSELELTRIIGCRRLSGIGEQRTDGGNVVLVRQVEHVHNQLQICALAEGYALRNAQVVEHGPWRQARIAAEIPIEF